MEKKNEIKPMDKKMIILDFSACEYIGEIHEELKRVFNLPEYYGENWDALWDVLDGSFDEAYRVSLEIRGINGLKAELREYLEGMISVFGELQEDMQIDAVYIVS